MKKCPSTGQINLCLFLRNNASFGHCKGGCSTSCKSAILSLQCMVVVVVVVLVAVVMVVVVVVVQREKNVGSRVALLPGKFSPVQEVNKKSANKIICLKKI